MRKIVTKADTLRLCEPWMHNKTKETFRIAEVTDDLFGASHRTVVTLSSEDGMHIAEDLYSLVQNYSHVPHSGCTCK